MATINYQLSSVDLVVLDLDGTLYDKRHLSLRMVMHALCDIRKMQAERHTRANMKGTYLDNKEAFYATYFLRLSQMLNTSADSIQYWYEKRYMPQMVRLIGKHHHAGDWVRVRRTETLPSTTPPSSTTNGSDRREMPRHWRPRRYRWCNGTRHRCSISTN